MNGPLKRPNETLTRRPNRNPSNPQYAAQRMQHQTLVGEQRRRRGRWSVRRKGEAAAASSAVQFSLFGNVTSSYLCVCVVADVTGDLSHWSDHREECGRLEQHMKSVHTLNDFPFTFHQEGMAAQLNRCSFLEKRDLHRVGMWLHECSCEEFSFSSTNSRLIDCWNLPSNLCPCTGPVSPLSKQLSSWKEYYEWRNIPLDSPVSLLLHWPLTIYHAMQMASSERVSARATRLFKIHYLGPERELFQLAVFSELLALLPSYEVHIDFVGPAVPQQRDGEKMTLYSYAHCDYEDCECKMARKNTSQGTSIEADSAVTLRLFRGFYHDRFRDMDSSPDLIIAPNAGIAAYRSWLATIELIKGLDAPAVFSDFCEEAAHLAARCLSNVFDSTLMLPIQLNPFRHPLAVEDSALRLPCYSNCYIFGI
ncbi:hypothetical protein Drorol1_Dr00018494 [Drosera rotundifolia]